MHKAQRTTEYLQNRAPRCRFDAGGGSGGAGAKMRKKERPTAVTVKRSVPSRAENHYENSITQNSAPRKPKFEKVGRFAE